MEEGVASQALLDGILAEARTVVEEAVRFAEESPWPEESAVSEDIYV
jgi:pyruvate dehydrogenase E1 component alpha subunit